MQPIQKRISFRKSKQIETLELQFGIRFFAFILDLMLFRSALFLIFFNLSEISILWDEVFRFGPPLILFVQIILFWLYFSLFEGLAGGTLGKLFVRCRVYNADGTKLTLMKAIIRFPLKIISIISIIGVFMIDIHKEKQGLHDLICKTIVRKTRAA